MQNYFNQSSIFPHWKLIVVPNSLVISNIRENLLDSNPNEVILQPNIITILYLEKMLAQELGVTFVSDWEKTFFLLTLVPELWKILEIDGPLESSRALELANELQSAFDRIRIAGINFSEVQTLSPEKLSRTLGDLGIRYTEWLSSFGLEDNASLRQKMISYLNSGKKFTFFEKIQEVKFFFFQRFSTFESEFVKALAKQIPVSVTMKFPKWVLDEVTPKKEGYLRRTLIRDLEDTGIPGLTLELVDNFSSSEIDNFKKPQELPAALKYASEYLYSPETNLEPPDLDDSLFIYQAPSAYMEMESAGRLIKAQILKGTEPHHLGVVVPNIPRYLPIIEDVGRRFGIRFYLQRGFPLEQSEPVLAILDLLSLFGSNWELKRVIRLLSSPYYNFGLATLPLEGLLNSKIIDDRAGCGFTDILSKDSINSDLQPVLEIVEKLKDKERDLLKTNDWKTFLEIFNETLEEFRWGKEIIASEIPPQTNHLNYTRVNDEYAKKSKHDSLGVEEFWKVFLELKNALIDSINSPKCNLLEFKIWLNKAINQRYVKISDPSSFSSYVQVLHYYNIHGAFFEGLFLLGLNEKVFPKGRGEGNYWPKEFKDGFTKKFVKRPIWTNSTERYFEEEEIVGSALGQANKVHLFYTHNPLDKNSSLPSPCILNLQALWPEGVLEAKRVGNQIPPPPNVLAEEQELRLYLLSLPANKRTIVENSLVIKIPNLIPRKEICFSPEENGEKYIEAFLNNVPRYNNQPILTIYPLLDYAKCPRFFWYKYILRLSIFPTISEVLTGRERGTLIHNTLEKFLYPLIGVEGEKNKDLISPNNLIKIFHNQALELKKRSSVGRLPIFEETLLELQNILLLWLERQNSFKDIKIIHLEWSFNANNKFGYSPLKIEAKSGQFYLQGRCDRIDVKEDKYLIRDYKLSYTKRYEPPKKTDIGAVSNNDSNGNYPSKENISRRISHYPLLMYALAWQEYITNQNLPVKEIQCLFEFLDPNNTYQLLYSSPKEISEIALLYDLLKQGNFEPNPLENEMMCDYCEYSNICEKS